MEVGDCGCSQLGSSGVASCLSSRRHWSVLRNRESSRLLKGVKWSEARPRGSRCLQLRKGHHSSFASDAFRARFPLRKRWRDLLLLTSSQKHSAFPGKPCPASEPWQWAWPCEWLWILESLVKVPCPSLNHLGTKPRAGLKRHGWVEVRFLYFLEDPVVERYGLSYISSSPMLPVNISMGY